MFSDLQDNLDYENINTSNLPDGADYVPRILIIDALGQIRSEFYNTNGNPDYKYFFYTAEQSKLSNFAFLNTLTW